MEMYVSFYRWYNSVLLQALRFLIFTLLVVAVIYQLQQQNPSLFVVFPFSLFLMVEIFFRYKVCRVLPPLSVSKNTDATPFESFTLPALYEFTASAKTSEIIKQLLLLPQMMLLLQKANFAKTEVKLIDISKDILAKNAFSHAKEHGGTFVTPLDIVMAYFLLTESETKLFFTKHLKPEDSKVLAFWLRNEFAKDEQPIKTRVRFDGNGIGETLVSGWTYETKKYTENFTNSSLFEEPLILGREKEFRTMLEGLVKLANNSVLLVGDMGSGKENLVRALAYQSFEGHLGASLDHRRVYLLLAGPLTAGVTSRSDLEVRLQNIIAEISHANDVILYIPDFQNIVGGTSYNLDLSGALLPYLKSGGLPVVATMTVGNYKTYMDKNPLKEAFSIVQLSKPDTLTAREMALGEVKKLERKYRVIFSYLSIKSAIDLADRFLQDAALPGSAVSLLETVANTAALSADVPYFENTKKKMITDVQVIKQVELSTNIAIGTPSSDESNLLLHLEDKLHERVINQNEAITAISEAMRRVRTGMHKAERPVSFLFLGPTGVGKTETAKALAEIYYGGEKRMIRLDMSEYTDETGLRRLLGAPPGEGDERGELTDKIHDNPSSIVLLDEFEKAHTQIHNLFLQVLDDGRLTDNKGVTVSFRNCIIIATSNAGSEYIREEVAKGTVIDKQFQHNLLNYLQTKAIFKPELLNRFDDVVTFKPLGEQEVTQVIKLMLQSLSNTLAEQDIKLVVDDAVIVKIAKEGFDRDFGARPLRRYIQDNIEDLIAQKKLKNEVTRGKTAAFSIDAGGHLQLIIS
jgi:ATP-dependent Clp protease ATP-binding subunit ClpC